MTASAAAVRADSAGDRAVLRGIGWTLLSMFLFACLDASIKWISHDFSAAQIMAIRFVVFLVLVAALIGPRRLRTAVRSRQPGLQVARVLLLLAEMAVFVVAVRVLPLGDVHSISAATPLMVTALAVPLLGETVGLRRWAAVGAGFAGLLLVVRPGFGTTDWHLLVPLGGAFLWAIYQILVRRVSRDDSADTTLLYTGIVGTVVMVALAPFDWTAPDLEGWALLLLVSVLGAGSHVALIKALAAAPASVLQPFNYTLTVWAIVLGLIVFGDFPDAATLCGAGLIVASGLYVWNRERLRRRAA